MAPMPTAATGCTKAQGAVMATRPASRPLALMVRSGLPNLSHMTDHGHDGPGGGGQHGVDGDDADPEVGARQGGAGVEAEPAEGQDQGAGHPHGDVVARDGVGGAVLVILADPGPEDHDPG